MFFAQTSLGAHIGTQSHILSRNSPATRPPQTSQLFGELALSFAYASVCSEFSPLNLFLHISSTASLSPFIF